MILGLTKRVVRVPMRNLSQNHQFYGLTQITQIQCRNDKQYVRKIPTVLEPVGLG
jgi:hypothetical protein